MSFLNKLEQPVIRFQILMTCRFESFLPHHYFQTVLVAGTEGLGSKPVLIVWEENIEQPKAFVQSLSVSLPNAVKVRGLRHFIPE
ncbi:MAG: hypothetical protein M0P12_13480 [Paludibacteraceae bacterium]|nr:hypothetical protein [Paludibacteraceae bacterium]